MLRDGTPCCTPRSTQAASAAAPSRTREDRFIVALTLPMTSENGKTKCDSSRPGRPRRITFCLDRKSTRLNSSHITISYAVFCLKKKKKNKNTYSYFKIKYT